MIHHFPGFRSPLQQVCLPGLTIWSFMWDSANFNGCIINSCWITIIPLKNDKREFSVTFTTVQLLFQKYFTSNVQHLIRIIIFQQCIQWFLYWHSISISSSNIRWTLSWIQTIFLPQSNRQLSLIKLHVSEKVIFLSCFRINVKKRKKKKNFWNIIFENFLSCGGEKLLEPLRC